MLDVASHIVSDDRLGEPPDLKSLFDLLAGAGWLTPELAESLRRMAGFRNVLVHEYARVDLDVVEGIVRGRLGDLEDFAAAVRSRLT